MPLTTAPTMMRENAPRALGPTVLQASIRNQAQDFQVTEELGFDLSGDGEHDFLWICKTGANTEWVARQLARQAGVHSRDVGYAGMKDRHAVTRQWFSVRRPNRDGTDWSALAAEGVEVIEVGRNARKLRRGAHAANHFRIALRGDAIEQYANDVQTRAAEISAHGIPNYFGEQRFGRNGQNLALAEQMFSGKRLRRESRGHALSAARSCIFNAILSRRVAEQSWNRLLPGDLANLDGSGSVFPIDEVTDELQSRCDEQDIHASATLWGDGAPLVTGDAAAIETSVVAEFSTFADGLCRARVDAGSRALRARVADLTVQVEDGAIWLDFRLSKGVYATAVLREIADYESFSST